MSMSHQNHDNSLHSSTTSEGGPNSFDCGLIPQNSAVSIDHNKHSPPLIDIVNGCDFSPHYLGFRSRHLSCIEENESDSFNSLVSDMDALSSNEMENSQYECRNFHGTESAKEFYCSTLHQNSANGTCSPNKFEAVECYDAMSSIDELRNTTISPDSKFINDRMHGYPAAMMNSCYGSLSPPAPFVVKSDGANEPIYAAIDKEIHHKSQLIDTAKVICGAREHNTHDTGRTDRKCFSEGKDYADQSKVSKCPTCNTWFDNDKKRKLIDSCGHERCYSCMFSNEKCPFCEQKNNYIESSKETISKRLVKSLENKDEMIKSNEAIENSCSELAINGMLCEPRATSFDSLKETPIVTYTSQTPKKKNFSTKGLRRSFGGGHRRTSSQGSLETTSQNECSVMDSSFHSDSAVGKLSKRTSAHSLNQAKGNGIHFSRNTYGSHLSTLVFGKIKSLWNAQSNYAGLNQFADVKSEGKIEISKVNSTVPKVNAHIFNGQATEERFGSKASKKLNQNIFSNRLSSNFRTLKDWTIRKNIPKAASTNEQAEKRNTVSSPTSSSLQKDLQYFALKPLFFEVPLQEVDPSFFGRQWILRDMFNIITSTEMPGVLVTGGPGSGKTSLILQLVDYSCFGRKNTANEYENGGIYCQINVCHERVKSLASQVVAYHFCQAENNRTCLVPDFVHSLAAQLCQAPQLSAYREYLLHTVHLQNILCMNECIANPERVMLKAILEPLASLKTAGKINVKQSLLLIDGLCEAEAFQTDYGFTILSFLMKIFCYFPPWLKIIATIRTQLLDAVKGIPYMKLSLDNWETNENVQRDLNEYIGYRIKHNNNILKETMATHAFLENLVFLAKGCFLYVKLVLDLIEKGQLSIKSAKLVPTSLNQLYLQTFNNRFSNSSSFDDVSSILSICLASLAPLTLNEIYYSHIAFNNEEAVDWSDFLKRFNLLGDFLVKRADSTYMFFHPSFRDWLVYREDGESCKYLVDYYKGHYAIAFRLSRLQAPLGIEHTLELAHHILKARSQRFLKPAFSSLKDVQAYWIASASSSVTKALGAMRNVYNPDIKVCKLLLLAGADPNALVELVAGSTIFCIAAYEGMTSLVSTLLEFGADVQKPDEHGRTPLILASMRGHLEAVRLLITAGSRIGQCDNNGKCALVYAVDSDKGNVVKYLLKCDWKSNETNFRDTTFEEAVRQSLLVAVSHKYLDIIEDILDVSETSIDAVDSISGETSLTKAATQGHVETVSLLISRGANIDIRNQHNNSPLLLAARNGHCSVVNILLERNSHIDQNESKTEKTALIISAEEGHFDIVKLLVENGANIEHKDINGLTALLWACFQGRFHIVKYLIESGADVQITDNFKRGPLDFASYQAPLRLVNLLLRCGAIIKTDDLNDVSALDRAVACRNISILQAFLKAGAYIGATTWTLAEDSPDILLLLLNHTVKQGNSALKHDNLTEASAKFQLALDKISVVDHSTTNPFVVTQLFYNLLLSFARCNRKMNKVKDAIQLSSRAITLIPLRYEGYYVRAKAYFVSGNHDCALRDIDASLERAGNASLYIKDILERTKLEIENRNKNIYDAVRESTEL